MKRLSETVPLSASASIAKVAPLLTEAKAAAKRQEYGLACALFEEAYWRSGQPAHLVTAANMRLKLGERQVAAVVYEHVLGQQGLPERLKNVASKKLAEVRPQASAVPSQATGEAPATSSSGGREALSEKELLVTDARLKPLDQQVVPLEGLHVGITGESNGCDPTFTVSVTVLRAARESRKRHIRPDHSSDDRGQSGEQAAGVRAGVRALRGSVLAVGAAGTPGNGGQHAAEAGGASGGSGGVRARAGAAGSA